MWIARESFNKEIGVNVDCGELILFRDKPHLETEFGVEHWCAPENKTYEDSCVEIDRNLFPNVTFENSPQEVNLTLKNTKL